MSRPSKPFSVITNEKKSHRTKAELKQRKQGEAELVTGVSLKEHPDVKTNPVAHKEFKRLNELLASIGKNDAIYEGIINRYCIITSECKLYENVIQQINDDLNDLKERFEDGEIVFAEYMDYKDRLMSKQLSIDKQIQTKRKMLFDIEKENIMTIAAALRSIPKKEEKKSNPLRDALNG